MTEPTVLEAVRGGRIVPTSLVIAEGGAVAARSWTCAHVITEDG
ncbi:MAG: hypothetical protein ACRDPW_10450 [Mycobacteriales bacterium]